MGRIQDLRNENCRTAFAQEQDPSDIRQDYFIDDFGNDLGFRIQRFNGGILEYLGEESRFLSGREGERLEDLIPELKQEIRNHPFKVITSCSIDSLPPNLEFDTDSVNQSMDVMAHWFAEASRQRDKTQPFSAIMNLIDLRENQKDSIFLTVHLEDPAPSKEAARTQIAKYLAQEYNCNYFFCTEQPSGTRNNEPAGVIVMSDNGTSLHAQRYDNKMPYENQLNNFLNRYLCMHLPYDTYTAIAMEKTRIHNLQSQKAHPSLDDLVSQAEKQKSNSQPTVKRDIPPLTK